jgi:hypothetical protein
VQTMLEVEQQLAKGDRGLMVEIATKKLLGV